MPKYVNVSDLLLIDVAKCYTGGFYYFDQDRMIEKFGMLVKIINMAGQVIIRVELEVKNA